MSELLNQLLQNEQLMSALGGALGGLLALGAARGHQWLKDYVKGTPTKLDDKILAKVQEALRGEDA